MSSTQNVKDTTMDQGFDLIDAAVTKLKRILEGKPEPAFESHEFTRNYTAVYNMCNQKPPNDRSQELYDKYIDHLHVRKLKEKQRRRLVGKENVRPMDNQTNVRAAKDALFFDVQDAMQKLKGLETEYSSSSEEFCYGLGETDEEDESI
ncbi:hypothetical protein Bca52824_000277 [Brassica carinata]|uniref:Uncharacterized protein n=1 Tax=Brassica carinata TaxID=52824 RepID=A0A8X8BCN1_BRACI|nr:hypothetical protein Bca52824_000277 [Brassica carinata]